MAACAVNSSRINHIQEKHVVPSGAARFLRSMAQVAWDRWPPAADPHMRSPPGEGGQGAVAAGAHTRSTRSYLYLRQLGALASYVHPLLTKFFLRRPTAKGCHAVRRPDRQPLGEAATEDSKLQSIFLYAAKYRGCAFWPHLAHTHLFQLPQNGLKVRGGGGTETQRRGYATYVCPRLLQTSSTARCGSGQCSTYSGLNARNCSKALR